MFYSQTFLGRKGPLGTVWHAAHLQNRLRKVHYTSTDIPKTVDYIMFSEVPIALRMSGHLLLGVVRIYSKKVEYLFKECKVVSSMLNNIFASSLNQNQPENTERASVRDVTKPRALTLDEVVLDDPQNQEAEDSHQKSHEDITLPDQIPDALISFDATTFHEDTFGTPQSAERQHSGVRLTEEQINTGVENSVPEIEFLRDADPNLVPRSPLDIPFHVGDVTGIEPGMNEKGMSPLDEMEVATPKGPIPEDQQHSAPPTTSAQEEPANFGADNSFGPNLVLAPSPPQVEAEPLPVVAQQQQARPRRKRNLYDTDIVLTNRFMKRALTDTSDILRKRKLNSSELDLWRLNVRQMKEEIFNQPLITGMSEGLTALSNKKYVSDRACSIRFPEIDHDAMATGHNTTAEASSPNRTVRDSPFGDQTRDLEIEQLRHFEEIATSQGTFPSPSLAAPSSSRMSDFTPFDRDMSAVSEIPPSTAIRSDNQSMSDLGMSTGPFGSDFDTPMAYSEENFGLGENRLSDIQELDTEDELNFLEKDDASPSGTWRRGEGGGSASARTRLVAQYLQQMSPNAHTTEGQSENLSLNKILEGKKRRVCARMFYEILLLKSHDRVDVQQDEPYGDISLKLAPTFSKA